MRVCCCYAAILVFLLLYSRCSAFCCLLLLSAAVRCCLRRLGVLRRNLFPPPDLPKTPQSHVGSWETSRRCIVEQILGVFQITTDRRASLNTPSAQINANATRKGHERHFLTFCIENRCLGTQDSALVVLQVVSLRTPSTTSQTYPTKETPASGGNVQTNNIPLVAHSFFRFPS